MLRSLLATLALLLAVPAFAADPGWQAGFATVSITPEKPMWMSGYAARTAPAEGTDTDLFARVMALRGANGHPCVLVTLDLVGIDRELSNAIRDQIKEKHKLTNQNVALAVSHTHCGPVVGTNLRAMYFLSDEHSRLVQEYTDRLKEKVLKAVDEAFAKLEPATVSWGVGHCGFATNRRENKEPQVPELRAKGQLKGPVDHDVPVLAVRNAKGDLKGIVFGYACHATVLSYLKWNADYPGYAAAELEKQYPGATALFVAGCGADQNPLPRRTVDLAKEYGRRLAAAVGEVLAGPMPRLAPTFAGLYAEIDLPYGTVPTREELVKETSDPNKYAAARAKHLLKLSDDHGDAVLKSYRWYPVQTWRLGGEVVWVNLGGEVTVEYALRLKRELGPQAWVFGYVNDVMAYIPSRRVLREGGYEGATSMVYYGLPSAWGERVEELIVEEVHRQAKAHLGK
jgi:hypothetical protein